MEGESSRPIPPLLSPKPKLAELAKFCPLSPKPVVMELW
jgi:hypothetical protein